VRPRRKKPVAERLAAKLDTSAGPSGCHLWTGAKTNGYGVMGVGRATAKAHRVAWELAHGPVPVGLFVCHRCDVRSCCNIAHLFLGTQLENMRDCVAKGRQSRGNGLRGEAHPLAKLTDDGVREIRRRLANGETGRAVAAAFGVPATTISQIKHGQQWKHVA